jgi:hypothetical protein
LERHTTDKKLRAGVLATVVVVSALLLLMLAGSMWLWETDFLLYSRTNYQLAQRANIESAFTLYRNDPTIMERLETDSTYRLYDSLPGSRMRITRSSWGLYEAMNVCSTDGRIHSTRLMGTAGPGGGVGTFWYRDNNGALTLSGRTNIKGKAALPRNGVIYGQMQSVFFSGEKLSPTNITRSETQIPEAAATAREAVRALFDLTGEQLLKDSLRVSFHRSTTLVAAIGSGTLDGCFFSGNIVLRGERLHIAASCRLTDVIVAARSVSIADGFRGRLQIFATDSVVVGKDVVLDSPSGIFAGLYADIQDGSEVNGYAIVDPASLPDATSTAPQTDIKAPNLRKSRTSRLRGLLYVNGLAILQGIVTGSAVVDEAVYYSPHGYYRHMVYDAAVLESDAVHYPLWLEDSERKKEKVERRKEAGWLE